MNDSATFWKSLLTTAIAVAVICAGTLRVEADSYVQTNLVSDISGLATIQDPTLLNPWGISHSATSPFWISDQGANAATLYNVTDSTVVTKVNINPPAGYVAIPPALVGTGPTGTVNNTNTSTFPVGNGGNGQFAHFIFANLNGTISAWNTQPTNAFVQVTTPGASYTGLAINTAQTQLYAANNAPGGSVDIFNSSFTLMGHISTPSAIPAGYVPFNVQNINGNLYVTYAPAGRSAQQNATLGQGAVAVFSESGTLQQTIIGGPGVPLAAPWGVALAPTGFGPFGGDLLVGNFSYINSEINAFTPGGIFVGTIPIAVGLGNTPGGLGTQLRDRGQQRESEHPLLHRRYQ
jgi:uncharacterized protein (TIGR03118 family)